MAALREMGPTEMQGREIATFSGAVAQRVALASALAAQSRRPLLDEPFGNVNRLRRADLLARLTTKLAGGQGVIIVTHDPVDVLELGPACC